ncbi:g3573 [Coccomyxa elongata]
MSRKEPRQLKELRNLMPFAWDARKEKHPPGAASMRDFQNCLQFSFKPRHSPAIPADVGQRKRRKKALDSKAHCHKTANLARVEREASPKSAPANKAEADNTSGAVFSGAWKDIGTPINMQSLQRTPGSGVSERTPACCTKVMDGPIPNTIPSQLSTGMPLSPTVAGAVQGGRWQESSPVPLTLLKEAIANEMESPSEPICASILKSNSPTMHDAPLLVLGVTTTQSAEKAAKGSGDEIEASEDLEQPDMVLLSSGKNVQRTGDISASKQISAADTRSLRAIEADSNQFSQGKENADPCKGAEQTCRLWAGSCGQSPVQAKCQNEKCQEGCISQIEPMRSLASSSSVALLTEKAAAIFEIKALDIQCTSAQPLLRPSSALAEVPVCNELIQTCPPLFQIPPEQKGKQVRPASTGRRSRPSSAVSARNRTATVTKGTVGAERADHNPASSTPADQDAFLFASAVLVLGSHYRVGRQHTQKPKSLGLSNASPKQAPRARGSLLQACALLGIQDAAAGWVSY